MSPRFQITLRAAEPENEKLPQTLLSPGQIVGRIHRPENVVLRHLTVKSSDEPLKSVLADERINLLIVHASDNKVST